MHLLYSRDRRFLVQAFPKGDIPLSYFTGCIRDKSITATRKLSCVSEKGAQGQFLDVIF